MVFWIGSVGDLTPNLRIPTLSRRAALIEQHGDESPHYIWCHDEFDDGHAVIDTIIDNVELSQIFEKWYQQLRSGRSTLQELRNSIQNVSKILNTKRLWIADLPATDDLIVYPGDMTHEFDDPFGDLCASVEPHFIDELRDEKLIGRETWWKLYTSAARSWDKPGKELHWCRSFPHHLACGSALGGYE